MEVQFKRFKLLALQENIISVNNNRLSHCLINILKVLFLYPKQFRYDKGVTKLICTLQIILIMTIFFYGEISIYPFYHNSKTKKYYTVFYYVFYLFICTQVCNYLFMLMFQLQSF